MKHPIVVGTNLTRASDEALIQAEARASRDGAPLTVVHAMSPPLWGATNGAGYFDHLRDLIAQQFTALTGRPRGQYTVVVEEGSPQVVLARHSASQGALLVVGSAAHHGLGHALLRGVGERVVERAWGPVLVCRTHTGPERILVAVDWPFRTSLSLDTAIDEASHARAELIVLHCINTSFLGTLAADIVNGGVYAQHPLGVHSAVGEARRALRAELQRRRVNPTLYVVEGEASFLISQFAARMDAGLVVVGTAHHPARTPPVTTAVLRHSPCSVLVVDEASESATAGPTLQMNSN
jgi:nucleotide-binding universal stress UspA family protein